MLSPSMTDDASSGRRIGRLPPPVSVPLRSSAATAGQTLTTVAAGPVGPRNAIFLTDTGLRLFGGPDRFDAWRDDLHVLTVDVDRSALRVGVQKHWWHRAEYQVVDTAGGAHLVHRVVNVAGRSRWIVPLTHRLFVGYEDTLRRSAESLAQRLDEASGT